MNHTIYSTLTTRELILAALNKEDATELEKELAARLIDAARTTNEDIEGAPV